MSEVIKRGDRIETDFFGKMVPGIAEKVGGSVTMITDAGDRRITDYPTEFFHSDRPVPLTSRFSYAILTPGTGIEFEFQDELLQGVVVSANYLELEVCFLLGGYEHTRVIAQAEANKLSPDITRSVIKDILEHRKGPITAVVIEIPWAVAV